MVATAKKTNERPGVRASVRNARGSAYKAREVLDLIRGQHVARALELLEFTDRASATVILKCLAKEPDQRYPDAASLELALAACPPTDCWTQKRAAAWWQSREGSAARG